MHYYCRFQKFYIDNKLVLSGIDYQSNDYYLGMDLENFKIAMRPEVGVASSFDLDNIDAYIGMSPKGYKGETLSSDYGVFTTDYSNNKIMYKKPSDECEHDYVEKTVAATCYVDGYSYQECTICKGQTGHTTESQKLEHVMVEFGRKEPTCTEYGGIYKKCENCGFQDKEVLAMTPHEIDKDADSYLNIPATCTSDGLITGECKVCHCAMSQFNGEYKFGHNIVDIKVVQEANCVRDGYSEGVCINCGITQRVNEIPAYGHTMKSRIVDGENGGKLIENYCIRCNLDEYTTTQKLYTESDPMPTLADMQTALGNNFYGGVDGNGFSDNIFSTAGNNLEIRFTNDGSSSTASKVTEMGNVFLRVKHTQTGYLNYLDLNRRANQDMVVELSLRLPATGKSVTGTMSAAQRTTGHNVVFNVFSLDELGNIKFIPGDCIIGQLTSEKFSKLSFVIKPGKGMVDAYFDGELKVQNAFMKTGDASFVPSGGVVYEYRFLFNNVTSGEQSIDVDDMYAYQASVPVYVTNPFLPDSTGRDYDISKNKTDTIGPYIANSTRGGILGSNLLLTSKKGFRATFEEIIGANGTDMITAIHVKKGANVSDIPGVITTENNSEISTTQNILNSTTAVLYNEVKFNSGSFTGNVMNQGTIILAYGRKSISGTMFEEIFLKVENGFIVSGDGKVLYTVKPDEWISYNVVINEVAGTYDVYINGLGVASSIKCNNSEYATKFVSQCQYKFMVIEDGEFDFYVANTALYAGAVAPISDITFGKIETISVVTEIPQKITAIQFYENQSVSSYYDYVDKIVLSGSTLTKLTGGQYANKDAVTLSNIDGKNVLMTTNYKTNNLKSLEFKNLVGVKLVSDSENPYILGQYDLTEYEYLSMNLYVEQTTGYNIIIKLMTKNGDYFQTRLYLSGSGWKDVRLPLNADPDNANAPYFKKVGNTSDTLADIVSIRIEFEGSVAGNGNGKLMDGTTIAFASIGFESITKKNEIVLGDNIDNGNFCQTEHTYVDDAPVAPTVTSNGYTKQVCSVCGHIAVKDIVPYLKDEVQGEPTVISEQSCTTDGIKIQCYKYVGREEFYYVISEAIPAKEHVITDGGCSDCGNTLTE